MEWKNENVLEFIELMRSEPAIWDRKGNSNQSRHDTNEAWLRIQSLFSLQRPVEELKRKRNCLMTAYRDYLKKIRDTSNNPSSFDDVYKPTWFAFDAIHSFMGSKYDVKSEGPPPKRMRIERWSSRDSDVNCHSFQTESETSQHSEYSQNFSNQLRNSQDPLFLAKKQLNEDFTFKSEPALNLERSQVNEYDLYGQLLAEKLKKMDEQDRLMVMNEIDNLVFKYAVNARSRIKSQSVDTAAFIAPSRQDYPKASGSDKKKLKMLYQKVAPHQNDACDSNDLSSDED